MNRIYFKTILIRNILNLQVYIRHYLYILILTIKTVNYIYKGALSTINYKFFNIIYQSEDYLRFQRPLQLSPFKYVLKYQKSYIT